jgi:hypothetical protein
MNTQKSKYRETSILLFIIDGYRFLYIVLTLCEYIWYELIIILGLWFPTLITLIGKKRPTKIYTKSVKKTILNCRPTAKDI